MELYMFQTNLYIRFYANVKSGNFWNIQSQLRTLSQIGEDTVKVNF